MEFRESLLTSSPAYRVMASSNCLEMNLVQAHRQGSQRLAFDIGQILNQPVEHPAPFFIRRIRIEEEMCDHLKLLRLTHLLANDR